MFIAPWIKLRTNLVVGNNANVAVAHGLPSAPTAVLIVPRAAQYVFLDTNGGAAPNGADGTNVYVSGTNAGSACDIYVTGGKIAD